MLLRWAWAPVAVFLLAEVIWGYPQAKMGATPPQADVVIADLAARILGPLIVALVVTAVVWFPSKSRLAATITFTTVVCLLAFNTFLSFGRKQRQVATRVLTDYSLTVRPRGEAAEAARLAVADGSALESIQGLDSVGEIDRRLRLLDAGRRATRALVDEIDGAGPTVSAALDASGVGPRARDRATADFLRGLNWQSKRTMFASNLRVYAAGMALLEFLKSEFGHWEYNQALDRVDLETDEQVAAFNALSEEYAAAIAENTAIENRQAGVPQPAAASQPARPAAA